MIDNKLIKMLGSPDVEKRKTAVKELARTKDREALPHLAKVFRSDKDPEVRELARKAGVYINKHVGEAVSASAGKRKPQLDTYDDDEDDNYTMPSHSLYYEEEEEEPEPEPEVHINVSDRDRERANSLLQSALDANMRGDNDRAAKYLAQALQINPTLKNDSYTKSLAAGVLGIASDEAIKRLQSPDAVKGKTKEKPKRKIGEDSGGSDPTWGDALIDLAIYGLINMGIVAISLIIASVALVDVLQAAANTPGGPSPINMAQISSFISTAGVPLLLLVSGGVGLVSIIVFLVRYVAIHIVATFMLGGDGTMPGVIHNVALVEGFGYPAIQVVSVGGQFLVASNPDLMGSYSLLNFLLGIGFTFWVASLIGKAYRFDTGRGCSAIILSYILMVVMFCVCTWLFSMAAVPPDATGF